MCQATGIKQYVSVKKWLRNKGPFSYFLPIYTSIALLPQCLSCLFRIHLIALSKRTLIRVKFNFIQDRIVIPWEWHEETVILYTLRLNGAVSRRNISLSLNSFCILFESIAKSLNRVDVCVALQPLLSPPKAISNGIKTLLSDASVLSLKLSYYTYQLQQIGEVSSLWQSSWVFQQNRRRMPQELYGHKMSLL